MTIRKVLVEQEFHDCEICGKVIEHGEEYLEWTYSSIFWTDMENSRGANKDRVSKNIVMCEKCGRMFLEEVPKRLNKLMIDIKEEISEA